MVAGERTIDAGTPESRAMAEGVRRAVACTERLNALADADRDAVAAAWSELTAQPVDPTFHLILDDIGGIELGDDVMLDPA